MPQLLERLVLPESAGAGKVLTSDANGEATWQPPAGGSAFTPVVRTADTAAIVATEVQVIAVTLAANLLQAGTTLRLKAAGTMTIGATPGTITARARIGLAGLLTEAVAAIHTAIPIASKTNIPFMVDFTLTCRMAGAAGTIMGGGTIDGSAVGTTGTTAGQTAAAAVNTTLANILQLTLQGSSGHSNIVRVAAVELVAA